MLYKSQAIVLRVIKYNEADKIVHLLSPTGPISAIAKGSRKVKSRFSGTIEVFCLVDLVLHEGKNLHTVTQASLIKSYKNIRQNYQKYLIATAAVEIIDRIIFKGQSEENLFLVLDNFLSFLNDNEEIHSMALIWLDWQVIRGLGLLPRINVTPGALGWFDLNEGAVRDKPEKEGNSLKVEPSTIEYLRSIINTSNIQDLSRINPENMSLKQLAHITEKFISYQLQLNLKSRSYLE